MPCQCCGKYFCDHTESERGQTVAQIEEERLVSSPLKNREYIRMLFEKSGLDSYKEAVQKVDPNEADGIFEEIIKKEWLSSSGGALLDEEVKDIKRMIQRVRKTSGF